MYICNVIKNKKDMKTTLNCIKENKRFESLKIGQKIQSYDKYGYYIIEACGVIQDISPCLNHAIIKNFDGVHYSTMSIRPNRIFEIDVLN